MSVNKDYDEEIVFTENLKSLVSAYEEIAVMRIERVRDAVLSARQFRQGLSEVFSDVQTSYQKQIAEIRKKEKKTYVRKHVSVLLTTNSRLSGPVTSIVTRSFIKHLREQDSDVVIIGQVGKERFMQMLPNHKYTFFSLPDGSVRNEDLEPFIRHILQYEVVSIFFARFHNLLQQVPTRVDLGEDNILGDDQDSSQVEKEKKDDTVPYLFEPSLENIVEFFNTQIFAVIIKQTWNESWLSLLGSRITAMEQASGNITEELKHLHWEQRREQRRITNKKQRDRLAGITLWSKK